MQDENVFADGETPVNEGTEDPEMLEGAENNNTPEVRYPQKLSPDQFYLPFKI